MGRNVVKDWNKENVFRDLFFTNPYLKGNDWIKHMYRSFAEMEDEGERAPPLSEIFNDFEKREIRKSPECTRISLVDLPDRSDLRIIRWGKDGRL
ncbi:MAG: hypothetical protein ACYCSO_05170 [Cuniculiplasma sp.]